MEPINYPKPSNTLAIAGLALAILAIVIALIPCFGIVAYFPALLGLICAIIGMSQNDRYRTPKSVSISGIAVSITAILIAGIWTNMLDILTNRVENKFEKQINNILEDVEKKVDNAHFDLRFKDKILSEEDKEYLNSRTEEISKITKEMASKTLNGIKSIDIESDSSQIVIKIPKHELTEEQIEDLKREIHELETKIRHYVSDFSITFEQSENERK